MGKILSRLCVPVIVSSIALGGLITEAHWESLGAPEHRQTPNAFAGTDLFRAVAFGQGAAALKLAEHKSLHDVYGFEYARGNSRDQIAAVDQLIAEIGNQNPAYFSTFSQRVQSGDPYAVSEAIDSAETVIELVGTYGHKPAPKLPFKAVPHNKAPASKPKQGYNINWHVNLNTFLNINMALNENVGVTVNIMAGLEPMSVRPFQRQLIIGGVAEALRS